MPDKDILQIRPISQFTDSETIPQQRSTPRFSWRGRIHTTVDPKESILRGWAVQDAKDKYNAAYNEYLEQHPVSKLQEAVWAAGSASAFPGDAVFSNLAGKPTNVRNEEAYKYAVEKSGYDPGNPNDVWRAADAARDRIGAMAGLMTVWLPLMLEASAGTFGAIPKLAADLKFAYDGYKTLTGPEGWGKTANFINQGRYGRAALSGLGDVLDASLLTHGVGTTGRFLNRYGRYAAKFNIANRGTGFRMDYPWQVHGNAIPNGTVMSEIGSVPMLQAKPLQIEAVPQAGRTVYQVPKVSELRITPQKGFTSSGTTKDNVIKRIFEIGMRIDPSPHRTLKDVPYFIDNWRYIMTGLGPIFEKRVGTPFATRHGRYYTGSNSPDIDLIKTYLYGDAPTKLIDVTDEYSLGRHRFDIESNNRDNARKHLIKTYQTFEEEIPEDVVRRLNRATYEGLGVKLEADGSIPAKASSGYRDYEQQANYSKLNTTGHNIEVTIDPETGIPYARRSDFWHFRPDRMMKNWRADYFLADALDKIGTPFILRSNWAKLFNQSGQLRPLFKTWISNSTSPGFGDFRALNKHNLEALQELGIEIPGVHEVVGKLHKSGGIIKGQNGFLNTWQKAYNSKFGKGLRDFMFGKDSDLSDEEYLKKHGYNKPVGGLGPLVEMTTIGPVADFSGVENLVKGTIGNGGVRANVGLKNLKTEKRALELARSFDEEAKRDKVAIEWAGKKWKDLTNTEQYWLKIRQGDKWNDKLIIPRP